MKETILMDCLTSQWDFLEWLRDADCLNEKGKKLVQDYWDKYIKM